MSWSFPADISFVDRDSDGYTDRLYAADVGGNVWRVDLEPAGNTPDKWQISRLAALGCSAGACASGTTPRKFFYPPSVLMVGVAGNTGSYDAVLIGSGDREHPLISTASGSAYQVTNRFYMLKDVNTSKVAPPSGTPVITETASSPLGLFNATDNSYDGTRKGYFVTLANTGEKSVNAATTVQGITYFGTNQPEAPSGNSCSANLGVARGYALSPFRGREAFQTLTVAACRPRQWQVLSTFRWVIKRFNSSSASVAEARQARSGAMPSLVLAYPTPTRRYP